MNGRRSDLRARLQLNLKIDIPLWWKRRELALFEHGLTILREERFQFVTIRCRDMLETLVHT